MADDIRIAPNTFLAQEAVYPGLRDLPAQLSFPVPFTMRDYLAWERAAFPINATADDADEADVDDLVIMRQYRAALAVGALAYLPDADTDGIDGPGRVSLANADPEDEDLPIPLVSWVNRCAGEYIGSKIIVQNVSEVRARRAAWRTFDASFLAADWVPLLPDLIRYPRATVTFKDPLTKATYRNWRKAMRIRPQLDARDPENRPLARQWRAAVALIEQWDVPHVPWEMVKRQDGYDVPLEVVSWVVDAADTFLTKRLNPKK